MRAIVTYTRDVGVVGEHESTDSVRLGQVGRPLRQETLYARWTPWYKLTELAFANAQETLVDLRWVHIALYDVQYGNVTVVDLLVALSNRDHHVLLLEQTSHHVEHGRLPHL